MTASNIWNLSNRRADRNVPSSAPLRWRGGAQFCMADGSVRFISENIDTGNLNAAPPGANSGLASPYGVYGSLGSRAGNEVVGEF